MQAIFFLRPREIGRRHPDDEVRPLPGKPCPDALSPAGIRIASKPAAEACLAGEGDVVDTGFERDSVLVRSVE